MAKQLYLIKLGEISLKGQNRSFFENRLKANLKEKLKDIKSSFSKQKGRFFLEVEEDSDLQKVEKALKTTFGIVGFAKAVRCGKEFDEITKEALRLTSHFSSTFKVETVRSDKGYFLTSYEISAKLGFEILNANHNLKVDVKNPNEVLYVEIRDKAYLYCSATKGAMGLPVATAGKGVIMLSGGLDSPVASYMMAKRGLKQEAVYFHAYPYTSDKALEKVVSLAKVLKEFHGPLRLHVIPFTPVQLHIKAHSYEEENTLLMRACMVKIATMIANKISALALVSGEALSQVASQTLESIAFTDSVTELPVFRPLIGMDKQEIITISKEIGTYDISILPFDDCCTIFSPKHPLVRPDKKKITASYQKMGIESLLAEAFEKRDIIDI
ncbi:MAG: tRNA uracil 4-sulfurtransferase ThiI [Sphaerochaetaceae bacterium]